MEEELLWNYNYACLREPKIKSWIPHDPLIQNTIKEELKKNDFNILDLKIDLAGYRQYLSNAEYHKFPDYYCGGKGINFIEKYLEHYVAGKLLNLSKDDIYRYRECKFPYARNISKIILL